jgi:hypothetical protein
MGRRALDSAIAERNKRHEANRKRRRDERREAQRASASAPHVLTAKAKTCGTRNECNRTRSFLLAINDQLRHVGDVVVSLDDACKDAIDEIGERSGDDDASLKEAVLAWRASEAQLTGFLSRFFVPFLKRTVVLFTGGTTQDDMYVVDAGTAPRDVFTYNGTNETDKHVLFIHVDGEGKFQSLIPHDDAPDARAMRLYRGGDTDGEGQNVRDSVFDAVNRQLRRFELQHETRDAAVWRDFVHDRMSNENPDVLRTQAPSAVNVAQANPHVRVVQDEDLGKFLLTLVADEIGIRVVVFKDANKTERNAIFHKAPLQMKYSGALLFSVERSATSGHFVFRSVAPRDAPSARATENETPSQRQRNARDAERQNPGGREQRNATWRQSRHRSRQADAETMIRTVSTKMRNALHDDNMVVCDVCDEEEFASVSEIKTVHLNAETKERWMEYAPQTPSGHATRSHSATLESVNACKTCAKALKNSQLPWAWKYWAPSRPVPYEVAGLNDMEYALIAPVQCTATVYVAHAGRTATHVPEGPTNIASQRVSKHNSFLFRRDVDASVAQVVPRFPKESGVVFISRRQSAKRDVVFPIRVDVMLTALGKLSQDNPEAYQGVRIDEDRIREFREIAQQARDNERDPDHAFDDEHTVIVSDDVVDLTVGRADASTASGSRSQHSSASWMHEMGTDDELLAELTKHLPQPRVAAVQHVNSNVARNAPDIGGDGERMVNEFDDGAEIALSTAFLRLFYGEGNAPHVVRRRLREAGWVNQATFSKAQYTKHLVHLYDGGNRRFQRDHQFLFYSFNAANRREISTVSTRLTSRNDNVSIKVVQELSDALASDNASNRGGQNARLANVAGVGHRLFDRLGHHMNPKRGSPASTVHARRDAMTLIQSPVCGRPALFVTVNPADTLWPEFFRRLVGVDEERRLENKARQELLAANPVLAARFFHRRLKLLFKHLLYGGAPIFGAKVVDHWYRIEFQSRGSPHAHCMFWLENTHVPDLVSAVDHAALFELAELASCSLHTKLPDGYGVSGVLGDDPPASFDPFDDYGGAYKPPRFQEYVCDARHVARRDAIVNGDASASAADLYALEVAFQQHVCMPGFCFQAGNPSCKRRYPRQATPHSVLRKTKDAKGRYRAGVQTPRNHRFVVPYNIHLIQAWRANVDVQVITDPKGAASYAAQVANYSTKPDTPDSREAERAMCNALKTAHQNDASGNTIVQKAANAMLGQTPISAQRAAWYLLGFDFVNASRVVKCVYIPKPTTNRRVALDEYNAAIRQSTPAEAGNAGDAAGDDAVVGVLLPRATLERNEQSDPAFVCPDISALSSTLQDYILRPDTADAMTLRDFIQDFDLQGETRGNHRTEQNERLKCGDIYYRRVKKTKTRVLRVSPRVAASKTNAAFAWSVLVLDTPWRSLDALVHENERIVDALQRQIESVAPHARHVLADVTPDDPYENIQEVAEDLQQTLVPPGVHEPLIDDRADSHDALADQLTNMYDDRYDDEATSHDGTNLAQFTAHASFGSNGPARFLRRVEACVQNERSSFLRELKQEVRQRRENEAADRVNLQTDNIGDDLQGTQRQAYDFITAALARGTDADQLRVAIIGEAGTGKSKLIHAITRFARLTIHPDAACVMAMMGCASYNVRGATVHSTLGFSVHEKGKPAKLTMTDTNRDTLSKKFAHVRIIIVDEVSLVDAPMLNAIDVQLKQIKNNIDPFGNIHIVFLGDFYQLHPILNRPLFRPYETQHAAGDRIDREDLAGRTAWLTVNVFFELDVNYRQRADTTGFIDTLRTARIGEAPTKTQLTRLLSRSCTLSDAFRHAGDDALWVTHENKPRAKINDADLRRANAAGSPTVHVWAQHSRKATRSALTIDGGPAALTALELKQLTHKDDGVVKPVTLPSLLRLAIGARVALTKNADNTVGTYNGASGTLVALEYDSTVRDDALRLSYGQVVTGGVAVPPIPVALVRFDSIDHKAPNDPNAHTCDASLGRNVVPVFPIISTIKIGNQSFQRRQLPLVLARATTIHKAQGRSVDNLVYAPTKPFGSGQAYVALSRVTRLQGLHIIQNDPHSELPIVPVDDKLFTAYNNNLTAVAIEMTRLRKLTPASDHTRPPGSTSSEPTRTAHARPRSSDPRGPDGPPQRRARR